MVRLKDGSSFTELGIRQFQFHYGTIKSTLPEYFRRKLYSFQFHYGTIKRRGTSILPKRIAYFNSTMVRLKERLRKSLSEYSKFQFHYGTIKSKQHIYYNRQATLFQFHYGTIKSNTRQYDQRKQYISIPLWYD